MIWRIHQPGLNNIKYLSILPPEDMAENIYSGYAYEMYYPPAGFEKANFVIKAVFTHLVSPLIKEFLSFPDPRSRSRACLTGESRRRPCESRELSMNWIPVFTGNPGFRIKCGMTVVYIQYLIPRSLLRDSSFVILLLLQYNNKNQSAHIYSIYHIGRNCSLLFVSEKHFCLVHRITTLL
jgi:hypothetical protein